MINPFYIVIDNNSSEYNTFVFLSKEKALDRAKVLALISSVTYEKDNYFELRDTQINLISREYGISVYEVFVK